LSACRVLTEEPKGAGFGENALAIAPKFRLTPEAARKLDGTIVIPIRFGTADKPAAPPRRAARFQRIAAYSRLGDAGPYYPDRAARARLTSVVEADCRVTDDGRLHGCRVVSVSTPGYAFELAFLKMAERGWMTAAPPPEDVAAPSDGVWRFRMTFDAKRH
jgi:TonB family protein